MRLVCMLVIFLSLVRVEAVSSLLTDGENKTLTSLENKNQELDELNILRQMINQETVIRLALVKNVHALVNDVSLLRQSLVTSETKISELQQAVFSLQQENRELKNGGQKSESRIAELERKLQTVNENVSSLTDHLYVIQKDSEEKRQFYFNKTNSVLDDAKIEVRYLSVTLLDFKEKTEKENESRDKKYEELERHFNSSIEDLYIENSQIKQDVTGQTALIQDFEDSQSKTRREFSENLNRTTDKFKTQFKAFEYEQLKLSSAVASLEVANMNLSKSNCDKTNFTLNFIIFVFATNVFEFHLMRQYVIKND